MEDMKDMDLKDKAIELIDIHKDYKLGNKTVFNALHGINLSFTRGELVSIVGESGSGKSTLMNVIGGLDRDFTGKIMVEGEDIHTFKEKQLDKYRKNTVGFVFQSFNLIPHLSILDNVTIAMTLSGVSKKEREIKATEMLKKVGLESQLNKKPNQLSGGQKQRVAIARALINEPQIILADEPTGALDSETTKQILKILKEIADEGKLVIMVTHSEKVAKISSRVIELQDGEIIRDETNAGYKIGQKESSLITEETTAEVVDKETKVVKSKQTKQNLSLFQAIRLSMHNMFAHKTKNILMSFGVAIGIMSVILMLAFGAGISAYMNKTMMENVNPTIVEVNMPAKDSDNPMNQFMPSTTPFEQADIDKLSALEGVINVEKGMTFVPKFVGASIEITMEGVDKIISPFALQTYGKQFLESTLTAGRFPIDSSKNPDPSAKKEIVLQAKDFKDFGGKDIIGKTVHVVVNYGATPMEDDFVVCGIIEAEGMSAVVPTFDDFYKLAANAGHADIVKATTLYLETENEADAKLVKEKVKELGYKGAYNETMLNMFNEMSGMMNIALLAIASISLLVSLIMILVVLYISVSERTQEIGVLKAIGARRKDIKNIFVSESFLIGLLSAIIGIVLSVILGLVINIAMQSALGFGIVVFKWFHFAIALGISILISMLAGLYPASKAGKLDPVESLRHE